MLDQTRLDVVSWEDAIAAAGRSTDHDSSPLSAFYERCLQVGGPASTFSPRFD